MAAKHALMRIWNAARDLEDPEMASVHDALGRVLQGHEPYPALAVDRGWNLVASNSGSARCFRASRPSC